MEVWLWAVGRFRNQKTPPQPSGMPGRYGILSKCLLSGGINETSSWSLEIKTLHQRMPSGPGVQTQKSLQGEGLGEELNNVQRNGVSGEGRSLGVQPRFESHLHH